MVLEVLEVVLEVLEVLLMVLEVDLRLQFLQEIHRKSGKNMQKSKIPKSWVNIPFWTDPTLIPTIS